MQSSARAKIAGCQTEPLQITLQIRLQSRPDIVRVPGTNSAKTNLNRLLFWSDFVGSCKLALVGLSYGIALLTEGLLVRI